MSRKRQKRSGVVLPKGTANMPDAHELSAAQILAEHFNCRVEFNAERKGYKIKTADIVMNGVEWEIKSPQGNTKKTISRQFKRGKKQSRSIILDIRRTELSEKSVHHQLSTHYRYASTIKRIIFIDKSGIVHKIK